ncbi:hypothetical protein [Nocardioides caldifontis]|uniref:hypothetical protein n=1 Tax=Nocardioides caldifontis TaxID=2588938 RepID=UPI0011E05E0F|nr:hypothetical protein [Nocardioides caldifontis]
MTRSPRRSRALPAVAALALALLPWAGSARAAEASWSRVGTGILQGVSGLAPHSAGGWVMVRDNKSSGQNRVALLGTNGSVRELSWPGSAPQDLEAIDDVPGQPGRYAVVTSSGAGRIIAIEGTTLRVVRSFTLPAGRTENEAFVLVRFGTTNVALWGNRGSSSTPGRLFASVFNVGKGTFGTVVNANVRVPYPTASVRHVSDAEVVGGRIIVSSASDRGNNGPFESALYDVGGLTFSSGRPRLAMRTPLSLATYAGHKIEGITCSGSTGLMGTDDENLGGFTAPAPFC